MADVALVTNAGLGVATNRIKGVGTEPKYIDWGTGTTLPNVTDIALETPGAEARVAGTSTRVQTTVANDTYQVVGEITCTGVAKAITEAGLFDAASAGTLFGRGTFSPINVSVGDSIQFTAKVLFEQG